LRQPGHGFVSDENAWLRGQSAPQFQLAKLDLAKALRTLLGLGQQADLGENLIGPGIDVALIRQPGDKGQRHADVLSNREAAKRARYLETACQSGVRPLPCRHVADIRSAEGHLSFFRSQCAGEAIDERALAGAVWTNQPD